MSENRESGKSAVCGLGTDSRASNSRGVVASHWTKFPPASALLQNGSEDRNLIYIVGLCTAFKSVSQYYRETCKFGLPELRRKAFF